MSELRVNTINGTNTMLKETASEAFQASLRGELLREGHTAYEDTRKIHNGMISIGALH